MPGNFHRFGARFLEEMVAVRESDNYRVFADVGVYAARNYFHNRGVEPDEYGDVFYFVFRVAVDNLDAGIAELGFGHLYALAGINKFELFVNIGCLIGNGSDVPLNRIRICGGLSDFFRYLAVFRVDYKTVEFVPVGNEVEHFVALGIENVSCDAFAVRRLYVRAVIPYGLAVFVEYVLSVNGIAVGVVKQISLLGRSVLVEKRIIAFAYFDVLYLIAVFVLDVFDVFAVIVLDIVAVCVGLDRAVLVNRDKQNLPAVVYVNVFELVAVRGNRLVLAFAEIPVAAVGVGKLDNELVLADVGLNIVFELYKTAVSFDKLVKEVRNIENVVRGARVLYFEK